ncbi:hypothetical protein [Geodermatophilus sabuli]|uniref:Uncharacterized protein n=1 Tax=Geodermatophilus sabuli TaxID=1564158 RepID=A0A285EGJ2_9ACTN|nr:hypothetical protein [Geodermatophilus sabuli]MBB3084630.1 hypothetical protein [Geodermatophilus sabuli]SNX97176.1 hypothetical protein SAMN06893097_106126 [Geodermatophilus sabuli]
MDDTLFHLVCTMLGYEPERVLSVRINPRQVVVTTADPAGELRSTTYRQSAGPVQAVLQRRSPDLSGETR